MGDPQQDKSYKTLAVDEKRKFQYLYCVLNLNLRPAMLYYELNRVSYGYIPKNEESFSNHVTKMLRHVPDSMNAPPVKITVVKVCEYMKYQKPKLDIFQVTVPPHIAAKKKPPEPDNQVAGPSTAPVVIPNTDLSGNVKSTNEHIVPITTIVHQYNVVEHSFGVGYAGYPFSCNDIMYVFPRQLSIQTRIHRLPFEFSHPHLINPRTPAMTDIHHREMTFFVQIPFLLERRDAINIEDMDPDAVNNADFDVETILKNRFMYSYHFPDTVGKKKRLEFEKIARIRRLGLHYVDLSIFEKAAAAVAAK